MVCLFVVGQNNIFTVGKLIILKILFGWELNKNNLIQRYRERQLSFTDVFFHFKLYYNDRQRLFYTPSPYFPSPLVSVKRSRVFLYNTSNPKRLYKSPT